MVVVALLIAAVVGTTGSAVHALQSRQPLLAATAMITTFILVAVLVGYILTHNILDLISESYMEPNRVRQ